MTPDWGHLAYVAAFALAIHGLVRFLGIVACFDVLELAVLPYGTTLLGGAADVGDGGIRVFVALTPWPGSGSAASTAALVSRWRSWRRSLFATTVFSLVLATLGWTTASVGVLANR